MSELRKMLKEFEKKYVYQHLWDDIVGVNSDNELICKMFKEVANRIEAIEQRQKMEGEE